MPTEAEWLTRKSRIDRRLKQKGWLVIIRLDAAIDNRFAFYFLTSPYDKALVDRFDNGSAQPNLSAESVERYVVPLPPSAEQQEIVRRVEALFALADQIEARYAIATAHVEKLTQSILTKAFRGELVPQDPNDEPAAVLLEKIRQTKMGDHSNRTTKRAPVFTRG